MCSAALPLQCPTEVSSRVHEADVTVGLWKVAQQLHRPRVDHLGEKAQVVRQAQELFKVLAGLLGPACGYQVA